MDGSGGRLGLVWESAPFPIGGRPHVVLVVQRGTRLAPSRLIGLAGASLWLSMALLVVGLPLRLLSLLVFRHQFVVGLLAVHDESVVTRSSVRGEKAALASAQALVEQRRD